MFRGLAGTRASFESMSLVYLTAPVAAARSNNLPIDIFGLYREVIRAGGFVDNERYDDYNRWTGGINFGGKVGFLLQGHEAAVRPQATH